MTEPPSDLAEASPSPATINTGKQAFISKVNRLCTETEFEMWAEIIPIMRRRAK